ncbi:hypothetical protein LI328DRAFT_62813 [Trichoderma asperelloides]|nr:hypothetical protein LI328DRAFT_62813 [Trichoderma asperelloides]
MRGTHITAAMRLWKYHSDSLIKTKKTYCFYVCHVLQLFVLSLANVSLEFALPKNRTSFENKSHSNHQSIGYPSLYFHPYIQHLQIALRSSYCLLYVLCSRMTA